MADTSTITRSAQVEADLSQIRTAVYGREVREAIANGIEHCYDDNQAAIGNANEAITAANTAAGNANLEAGNAAAATRRANNAATAAENVNATASKVQDGPYQITVTNSQGNRTIIEIPDPSAEVKKKANLEAVTVKKTVGPAEMVTFEDGVDAPAVLTKIKLEPKQDLHGYDHPWVGGSGKNLLGILLSDVKSTNTTGTWDGDSYTYGGIVYKCENVNGYISRVTASGKASINSTIRLYANNEGIKADHYILSGCPADGSSNTYYLRMSDANATSGGDTRKETGSGADVQSSYIIKRLNILIESGVTVSDVVFTPMLRLATETDPAYEPYSNICPIEGYDAVNVRNAAKNILDLTELLNAPSGSIPGETYIFTHLLKLPVKKNTQYTLSTNYTYTNGVNLNVLYFNTSKSSGLVNSASTRTANSGEGGVLYIGFIEREGYLEFVNGNAHAQLEEGNSATEYAAYNGSTTSVSLASAGTVYGGELTLNEDGSGSIVIDKKTVKFSDLTWAYNSAFGFRSMNQNSGNWDGLGNTTGGQDASQTCCSAYERFNPRVQADLDPVTYGYAIGSGISVYKLILKDPRFGDDVSAFLEAMGNETVCYTLATPTIYSLTATQVQTLVGTNHVWTDAGEITLTYRSDKYAELERRLSQLEALVLES